MTKAQRWVPATHLSTLHDMFKRHYPKHLPEPGIEAPRRGGLRVPLCVEVSRRRMGALRHRLEPHDR